MFERGYNLIREKVSKGGKYIRCCQNCKFFSKEVGDKEEVCQNSDVLKYDIVVTENSVYCIKWQPYEFKDNNSLFKRGGKSVKIKGQNSETKKPKTRVKSSPRSFRKGSSCKRSDTDI